MLLILGLVAVAIPSLIYLFWAVHCALNRICVSHARQFCQQHGLEICRVGCRPVFESAGGKRIKTEFTLVQLECLDGQKQRKRVLLQVWLFGIRKVVSIDNWSGDDPHSP